MHFQPHWRTGPVGSQRFAPTVTAKIRFVPSGVSAISAFSCSRTLPFSATIVAENQGFGLDFAITARVMPRFTPMLNLCREARVIAGSVGLQPQPVRAGAECYGFATRN